LEIFISYKIYSHYLKWLTFSLFAYIATAFIAKPEWLSVLKNLIWPSFIFQKEYLFTLVAVLGTTISPYLFFWQASNEVEEEIVEGKITPEQRKGANTTEIKNMRLDVILGMLFSNLIAFFIILTAALTLFKNGIVVSSAYDAAQALAPLSGRFSSLLFAIGIIGTGLLGIPILAGSFSYALSEALEINEGLSNDWRKAKGFYLIIILATLIGLLINFIGINPIQALIWAAVINGLITPILLIFIVKIGNDKKIMGQWKNKLLSNFFGWLTIIIMTVAIILMFVFWK